MNPMKIEGIGESTIEDLEEIGLDSVKSIANADLSELQKVFDTSDAIHIRTQAQNWVEEGEEPDFEWWYL